MSEIDLSANTESLVDGFSEQEQNGKHEQSVPKIQWTSKPCQNVATVRPSSRNDGEHARPTSSTLLDQSIEIPHEGTNANFLVLHEQSVTIRSSRQAITSMTLPRPFSFDARDSMRRVAHEKRMEELRHMERTRLELRSRFRANPIRKYKPLVLTQSTRPLTVPQAPFSSRDT